MKAEVLKQKRTWAVIIIIIIILLLLKACLPSKVDIAGRVNLLIMEIKETQEELNEVLDDSQFEDLCTAPYANKFKTIGNEFIDLSNQFSKLKIEGDPNKVIPNYKDYQLYFKTYNKIGNKLIEFSNLISKGKYQEAITKLKELKELNNQLPIIK